MLDDDMVLLVLTFCIYLALRFVTVAGGTQTLTDQEFTYPHFEFGSITKQCTNLPFVGTCHLGHVIEDERSSSGTVARAAIHAQFVAI
jgi:hypothetical protein